MNNIHIFTEVKRQSFNELAKAIERIRQNNSRRWVLARQFQKESLENSNFPMEFPPERVMTNRPHRARQYAPDRPVGMVGLLGECHELF